MHPHSPSPQDPVGNPVVQSDLTNMEIGVLERRLPGWIECSKDKKGDNFKVVCDELRALPYVTALNRSQWDSCKKVRSNVLRHIMVERLMNSSNTQQYKTWMYNHSHG
ncbi:hypothetical protein PAXRUDRAFT_164294 [Paxillus rubicundulus Ve08.2h10]|uniref:Unplaced genomic scaffold scaffold_1808, whole genome shotgun sequence n=1 Tax=Paxillus rubicundulus Ve08.2h10 TaxID=930991 RepID=A0A0D0DCC0_9AGAM|nr:hypothetical protein PAXRUDRAFT_164294 [Paxillus rubicundulus Ve08.2h10]